MNKDQRGVTQMVDYSSIHFGTDYYPEHWPKERWETDARLMKAMGIKVVRMAEFSWHKMEPQEGAYCFDWLEDILAILEKYGIKAILGTPTAAPPAWLVNKYPDILPVDKQGITRGFGGRHHDCQSNQNYRRYIAKIVTAMADQFATNPNVIGWQIDNELGNSHQDLCMCDSCRTAYQKWLKKKYGSIDVLNKAWGTYFWSQEYNSFEEIFTPKITAAGENPSAMLDWKCFCSDLIVDFQQMQINIIREKCPNHFITHNFMGFSDVVDYFDLGEKLDFVSHDQYPGLSVTTKNYELSAGLDLMRGIKGQTYWIMEQQAGITGWQTMGRNPAPGQLSTWAFQSIVHGADSIVFFRWRTCTAGTEQYWHGILPHSGNPGRRYFELQKLIEKMNLYMDEMKNSMPRCEVAIVFSYRQDFAIHIQPQHPELKYIEQLTKYYEALYKNNIPVDFIQDDADFTKYKLVIEPLQYLMNPKLEKRYFDYVEQGGHLILTMRTGVKDPHNICMSDRELPGKLGDLCGIEVLEYDCLNDVQVKVRWSQKELVGNKWADIITLKKAAVLATYGSEFYAGSACITENNYGAGKAYYVGTEPERELMKIFMEYVAKGANISSLGRSDDGVELMIREDDCNQWIFVMNYGSNASSYQVPDGYELVIGEKVGVLQGYESHLYVRRKAEGAV